jgi:hypothetical protein
LCILLGLSICVDLSKLFYGLKQAPRAWHTRLGAALRTHGFVPSTTDTSLFLHQRPEVTMYVLVYIDDIILISSSDATSDHLIASLGSDLLLKTWASCIISLA